MKINNDREKPTGLFQGNINRCTFLLVMSWLYSLFLGFLNLYILYKIVQYFLGDGFSFLGGLFIAFSFVITIPAMIFSLRSIRWIAEGEKHKFIVPVIIGILGILTGLILHNATGLWIYILIFGILLLISCVLCRKRTKTDGKVTALMLAGIFSVSSPGIPYALSAQTNNEFQEISLLNKSDFNPYVEFYSSDITDFFNPESSGGYPSTNLFDGFLKTCWVTGSSKKETHSVLYIKLPENIDPGKLILNIFSGYGKSKDLYLKNSRPKSIKVNVFAAFMPEGYIAETSDLFLIKKWPGDRMISLTDTFGIQTFPLHLDQKELLEFRDSTLKECAAFSGKQYKPDTYKPAKFTPAFIVELEITDTYQGSKYDDICISEIFFNNRFVTPYPDRYKQITDVYIKNDNTLLVDYKDEKGIIICKDTSSVFTMVDRPKNANWAILHYVPNSSAGPGSRNEERYHLVDLKNRKIVDKEFEKYTDNTPMYGILEIENDRLFIENIGKYSVELR